MKKRFTPSFIARGAMIASVYVVLTYFANMLGLASFAIQLRFSEMLNALCLIFPEAVFGVSFGCFLSNILTGCIAPDIVFGTLATVIGAVLVYLLRHKKYIALFMPVISNTIIIPFILKYAYSLGESVPYFALTIFIGEFLSVYVMGLGLIKVIKKRV